VIDLVPTILELAGVAPPSLPPGPRRPGRSLVPVLVGNGGVSREYLWWLHEENRAIRVGDWKLVSARADGGRWELYDLARDRAESDDRASDLPWKVRQLARLWLQKARQFARDAASAGHRRTSLGDASPWKPAELAAGATGPLRAPEVGPFPVGAYRLTVTLDDGGAAVTLFNCVDIVPAV
jgi:arylsulfatase A-like enzyme